MRPHREPYLQRARERHLRRARATHARTGKGPVPVPARRAKDGGVPLAPPRRTRARQRAKSAPSGYARTRSLVSLSLSLCACGVPGGLLARGLVSAMPPAAAVQRWPKGHLGCDKRGAWVARSPRRVTQLSPRRGGSLDSLQKAGACLGCPLSGHNQTSTKQNTVEKVQRCSGYN